MPQDSSVSAYDLAYQASVTDPEAFWAAAAEALHWDTRWDRVLDDRAAPLYRWFTGGKLNTCYNAIDRHVLGGRADQAAVIYDSPVTKTKRTSPIASCGTRLRDSPACCGRSAWRRAIA